MKKLQVSHIFNEDPAKFIPIWSLYDKCGEMEWGIIKRAIENYIGHATIDYDKLSIRNYRPGGGAYSLYWGDCYIGDVKAWFEGTKYIVEFTIPK